LAAACGAETVSVSLLDSSETLARFRVENHSDRDVRAISFEVTSYDQEGAMVGVDTVRYTGTTDGLGNQIPFVAGGRETFIVVALSPPRVEASAKVLDLSFFDP
jgi:hypothetical protein